MPSSKRQKVAQKGSSSKVSRRVEAEASPSPPTESESESEPEDNVAADADSDVEINADVTADATEEVTKSFKELVNCNQDPSFDP